MNRLTKTGREDPNSSVSQYLREAALKKEADKKKKADEAKAACAEVDGVAAVDEASVLLSAMLTDS